MTPLLVCLPAIEEFSPTTSKSAAFNICEEAVTKSTASKVRSVTQTNLQPYNLTTFVRSSAALTVLSRQDNTTSFAHLPLPPVAQTCFHMAFQLVRVYWLLEISCKNTFDF